MDGITIPGGMGGKEAVRRLNDLCGLRDCPQPQEMVFAEDRDLLGQWLQVMLAAPPPLDHRGQPTPPAALRKATRTRPLGKTARRRQRRSDLLRSGSYSREPRFCVHPMAVIAARIWWLR